MLGVEMLLVPQLVRLHLAAGLGEVAACTRGDRYLTVAFLVDSHWLLVVLYENTRFRSFKRI